MNLEKHVNVELDWNIKEFKEYVFSYYGTGGIEDIGATKEQIEFATFKVIEYCLETGESDIQGAFSSDLNLIKDILIKEFNLKS
tara:strand:- start:71 stop:322 length:252 start_codon:yes stop_codon:yes gene_type:complete